MRNATHPRSTLGLITLFCLISLLILPGCGQSDKDKAMDLADKYEEVIDKYADEIKSQKDSGDMQGMMESLAKLQEESMDIVSELEGLEDVLSEEDKEEVKARFESIAKKMTDLMGM